MTKTQTTKFHHPMTKAQASALQHIADLMDELPEAILASESLMQQAVDLAHHFWVQSTWEGFAGGLSQQANAGQLKALQNLQVKVTS